MRLILLMIFVTLSSSTYAVDSERERYTRIYMESVLFQTTAEICAEKISGYSEEFNKAYSKWKEPLKDKISRAKENLKNNSPNTFYKISQKMEILKEILEEETKESINKLCDQNLMRVTEYKGS